MNLLDQFVKCNVMCLCVCCRYTRCPLPTCPVPKVRAKRLRMLPPKWLELPPDVRDPVIAEFRKSHTLY